ncbi:hypothetical protein LMIY3S_05443 [Labrys miyagiensis]
MRWFSLSRHFGGRARGKEAQLRLALAYHNLFAAGSADAQLVLADLADFTGFYRVNGPGIPPDDRAFSDGMRAAFGRLFHGSLMTISSYDNRRSYAGNGSTFAFAFPPPFFASTDLVVQVQAADGSASTKILGVDYTVSGAGNPAGGTVTMLVPPAAGTTLILYRDVPLTQPVALLDGGPLPAATLNGMFDRVTMWGQRLKEQAGLLAGLASGTASGQMSAADKAKLDGIQPGAQVNAVTSVAGRSGDVTLGRGDVGLGNVDNTPDTAKPVSTAQATADAAILASARAYTDGRTKADIGLGNVDNTSDLNKPIGTATQTALNAKANAASLGSAAYAAASAFATATQGTKADSAIQTVNAGVNITVDNTDPKNPVISASGAAVGGDVNGPASSTDNRLAAFSGTNGKLLKDSGVTSASFATAAQGAKADTAVQPVALSSYAPLASPALTGSPTAPTAAAGTSTVQLATTAFVTAAVAALSPVYQAAAAILSSLTGLASNGLIARTASGSVAARTITAGTGAVVANGDGVAGNPAVGPDIATVSQYRAATANKMLEAGNVWAAAGAPQLADAATIALDFSTGFNFYVSIGGNRTLDNPTNMKTGQTGSISIYQDGTGNRTLAFSSAWKFAGGTAPSLSTAANAWDKLYYVVEDASTSRIHASLVKGIA